MMKKIVVDCLGGDNGMAAAISGAAAALSADSELSLVLVGDEKTIKEGIEPADFRKRVHIANLWDRVEIIHTTENIPVEEHPTDAIRKRPNSSIVLGLEQLKTREDCGAFVSAGSTGALLTGGFFKVGRIAGVSRPALCPNLPTKTGVPVMLIDCGANVDCKPENLVHFAIMANEYKKAAGVKNPRIALLNVGVEDTKGNETVKQTYRLLQKLHDAGAINFVGNAEAHHTTDGEWDVIVTDGFAGNVLLKGIEGISKFIFGQLKRALSQGARAKAAALLVGGKIKKMKSDYLDNTQAGSIFLGLKKPVVKAHGNASAATVAAAIAYAKTVTELALSEKIANSLAAAEKIVGGDLS